MHVALAHTVYELARKRHAIVIFPLIHSAFTTPCLCHCIIPVTYITCSLSQRESWSKPGLRHKLSSAAPFQVAIWLLRSLHKCYVHIFVNHVFPGPGVGVLQVYNIPVHDARAREIPVSRISGVRSSHPGPHAHYKFSAKVCITRCYYCHPLSCRFSFSSQKNLCAKN
jgi:hypothetical protein